MITLIYDDQVAILDLGDTENRFSPDWLDEINARLDEVIAGPPTALIVTATGKFFSNGLDLDWAMANPDKFNGYIDRVHALLSRMLTMPVVTVGALNGHTFGAGALLAMAFDFRVMRSDRGFFCFPEVDIKIPFTPGMSALIQAKLTPAAATLSMITGRRFGGGDAAATGIVDRSVPETELLSAAKQFAVPLVGKDRDTLGRIKASMYPVAVAALALPAGSATAG